MDLFKIDNRIPKHEDLILLDDQIVCVADVDIRKKIIWVDTTRELKKIPLKKYDIYSTEEPLSETP